MSDPETALPTHCPECGTWEYAQDVMRRQEKAIDEARRERDELRAEVERLHAWLTLIRSGAVVGDGATVLGLFADDALMGAEVPDA